MLVIKGVTRRVREERSKCGVGVGGGAKWAAKINILKEKIDFLRSKNFKLDLSQIKGNSIGLQLF